VFARRPWDNGILSHKFMELLYMGIDASCTHNVRARPQRFTCGEPVVAARR